MLAFNFFGATEGGLFDINATLPLMAIQVVALTYILNSLFFRPVGNIVEKREKFVSKNINKRYFIFTYKYPLTQKRSNGNKNG